jgi:hypothetical protein
MAMSFRPPEPCVSPADSREVGTKCFKEFEKEATIVVETDRSRVIAVSNFNLKTVRLFLLPNFQVASFEFS